MVLKLDVENVLILIYSRLILFKSNPNLGSRIEEYEFSLENSDYILCPRGSGNTSIRFYESLSAGRTPILIDSGGNNPKITNDVFWRLNVVNVSLFSNWSKQILDDWAKMAVKNNYENRQKDNHKIFLEELRFDNYLKKLFQKYLLVS